MNHTLKGTFVRRDYRGAWAAKSVYHLEDLSTPGRECQLTIHTSKVSNGRLVTNASIGWAEPATASGYSMVSHMMFQDYSKRISQDAPGRVTDKVVSAQHAIALDRLDDILDDVKSFYKKG